MRWKKIYPRDLQSPTIQQNLNKYLRTGCIVAVNAEEGVCDVRWFDRPGIRSRVLLTQANDKDYYIPEVGSFVIVGFDSKEQARILRYISRGHATRIVQQHSLPNLKPGESLREVAGTIFHMQQNGDVVFLTPDQNKVQLEATTGTFSTDTINVRNTSEAGVSFMGLIKRMVTSLGSKSLQFIKNAAGDYLTEYRLQIIEKADNAVGVSGIPIVDIIAGTLVDDDGNIIDKNGNITLADSPTSICLSVVVQRSGNELLNLKIAKDGKTYLSMAESIALHMPSLTIDNATLTNPTGTADITINSGTNGAARLNDEVQVTIASSDIAGLGLLAPSGGGPITQAAPATVTVKGTITKASSTVKIGD